MTIGSPAGFPPARSSTWSERIGGSRWATESPRRGKASMAEQPAGWVGWHRRPGGRWSAVCAGPSWEAAWDSLLRVELASGEMVVLAAGKVPWERPARYHGLTL